MCNSVLMVVLHSGVSILFASCVILINFVRTGPQPRRQCNAEAMGGQRSCKHDTLPPGKRLD